MGDMETTDNPTTESSEWKRRSEELVRPLQGRAVAGVAKGVADNFGLADWIPRVFFIVTAFMGGLGIVLYAACWAFIRSEDESESIADRFFSGASTSRSWIGIGLIVIAGIIILGRFTFLAGEVIWATVFLVVGLLLYTGNLPSWAKAPEAETVEPKEGVQRMSSTDTTDTKTFVAGDSPAGGTTPPPIPPTPSPVHPEPPPTKPRETSFLGRLTMGAILVGLGVLAILDNIPALAIDARPRHYLALAVTILGIGLLVGSVLGRARWLILIGVIMIPSLIFNTALAYDWDSPEFNRELTPVTFEEVPSDLRVDVGRLSIDLSELPWDGEELVLDAEVSVGSLEVTVPDGVGIVGQAGVSIGRVEEPGRSSSGLGDRQLTWHEPGELGTVLLDAEVSIGNIEISR